MRLDDRVVEVDRLLCVVAEVGDVAGGVVGVGRSCRIVVAANACRHGRRGGRSCVVVAVGRANAVAVVDARALALGVVIDVGDEDGGRGRTTHADGDAFEQVGFVVIGARDATVRRGDGDRAIEGVVGRAGFKLLELGLERRLARPVGMRSVLHCQSSVAAQQVALVVIGRAGDDAGRVEDAHDSRAQIVLDVVGLAFAVLGAAEQQLGRSGSAHRGRARTGAAGGAARRTRCGTRGRGCPRREAAAPRRRSASSAHPLPCWSSAPDCRACRSRSA